jgi:phage FluMu protein Com
MKDFGQVLRNTENLLPMAKGIDFFNSMEHLEPKCPKCESKIDWGINTEWSDEKETQICKKCGSELNEI